MDLAFRSPTDQPDQPDPTRSLSSLGSAAPGEEIPAGFREAEKRPGKIVPEKEGRSRIRGFLREDSGRIPSPISDPRK